MHLTLSTITFILSAGVAAFISPCGYVMFPGYITYYLGYRETLTGYRALLGGFACSLGLITVFIIVGSFLSLMGSILYPYIPYLAIPAGIVVVVLGVLMIIRVNLGIRGLPLVASRRRGVFGLYVYGLLYGLAIISCTAPIFLSIILVAFSTGGLVEGITIFLIYAVGMVIPLLATTLLVYKAKEYVLRKIVHFTQWSHLIGGVILIFIGLYIIATSIQ